MTAVGQVKRAVSAVKGKFTIIMRRRPSEDQGCLLVRHLFYSMSQIPFMVEDGGQRFIRIPGEKEYIRYENGRWI